MKARRWALTAVLLGATALGGYRAARAETIAPGQVRVVQGSVSAVDPTHRAVVLEVATARGPFTVGVTLDPCVVPKVGGAPGSLADIAVGSRAELRYTRVEDRLVGLDFSTRP